jgi:hypothetical protein
MGFNLNKIFLPGEIADISTASSVRIPIREDMDGEVVEVATVLGGAIATSDATVTVSKNNASMGTVVIATASSAEGDIDTLVPTSANKHLVVGDWLELTTDGASTNTVPVGFTVTIRR